LARRRHSLPTTCRCRAGISTCASAQRATTPKGAATGRWGEDLSRLELGNPEAERATRIVIGRLADYVWQLQKPAPQ
jgi:hypothetical protein